MMTKDHPFDYGSFEGVIPPKQHGAGSYGTAVPIFARR